MGSFYIAKEVKSFQFETAFSFAQKHLRKTKKMNFEEFKQQVMEDLPGALPERLSNVEIEPVSVTKLQHGSYDGITIREEGSNIGMNLDLSGLFERMEKGTAYDEMLAEMMGADFAEDMGLPTPDVGDMMYVASTPGGSFGAGVITYPEFMDQAAEKVGGDFYVLPSSVHEVLIVPDKVYHYDSKRSIEYAIDSAKNNNMPIEYIYQKYLDIMYQEKFDVITLIYCDFGVMSNQDRNSLLKRIYQALKPGGIFILDVFTPNQYKGREEPKDWYYSESGFWSEKPHICLNSFYRYDDSNTILDQTVVITEDSIECYNIWDHTFIKEELEEELQKAGFTSLDFYGDVAGDEYKADGNLMCAVAKKKGREVE